MNINEMSVEQLKALAYDELAKLEQAQQNIRILNLEIQKRVEDKKPE